MKRNYEKYLQEYATKFANKGIFYASDYYYIHDNAKNLYELIDLAIRIGFITGYRRANADRYRRNRQQAAGNKRR